MITFFTTAKSFKGDNRIRQINAIRSWQAVHPDVEVLLFGKGVGYSEIATELGLVHIPDVATNELGVPRVDSMFAMAASRARHPIQSYINCDIVLLDDFLPAIQRIKSDKYLIVAQRYDVDLDAPINFESRDWQSEIRAKAKVEGKKLAPCGIDFFLQRGGVWGTLPPMVVGRGKYDNWLIYHCRSRSIPVVDITEVVTVIHENHDYGHINGGRNTVQDGEDAGRNLELGGGFRYMFTIQDADWRMTPMALIRNWCRGDSERYGQVYEVLHEKMSPAILRVSRLGAEIMCELNVRFRLALEGHIMPLIKLAGWWVRRMVHSSAPSK